MSLGFALGAQASESEATSCVRTKVWESYDEGWSLRTLLDASLVHGDKKVWKIGMYSDRTYRLMACGVAPSLDLDIVIYDGAGKVVLRDDTRDRQPGLSFVPAESGAYYVVLHARQNAAADVAADVALAVLHK